MMANAMVEGVWPLRTISRTDYRANCILSDNPSSQLLHPDVRALATRSSGFEVAQKILLHI